MYFTLLIIGDFGVSKKLNDKCNSQGSIAYCAPERAFVGSSSKSDVFSLGLSALEMASGQYPFKNVDSIFALFNAICQDPIPVLPNIDVSDDCKSFISKW